MHSFSSLGPSNFRHDLRAICVARLTTPRMVHIKSYGGFKWVESHHYNSNVEFEVSSPPLLQFFGLRFLR